MHNSLLLYLTSKMRIAHELKKESNPTYLLFKICTTLGGNHLRTSMASDFQTRVSRRKIPPDKRGRAFTKINYRVAIVHRIHLRYHLVPQENVYNGHNPRNNYVLRIPISTSLRWSTENIITREIILFRIHAPFGDPVAGCYRPTV